MFAAIIFSLLAARLESENISEKTYVSSAAAACNRHRVESFLI